METMKQELKAEMQELLQAVERQEEERTSINTAQKRSGKEKRTEMKVKLEETTGRRDTAKNTVRNEKEKNEKNQVKWNEKKS